MSEMDRLLLELFFTWAIVLFFVFVWLAVTWKKDPLDEITPDEFKEESKEVEHADTQDQPERT